MTMTTDAMGLPVTVVKLPRPSRAYPLKYRLTVFDTETGKIEWRSRWRKSESWVVNFQNILYCMIANINVTATDNLNASETLVAPTGGGNTHLFGSVSAGATTQAQGIQVGTGTGAVAQADIRLGTLIAHGTGAGQLSYGATRGISNSPTVSTTFSWTWGRDFSNTSGGSITVEEVGVSGAYQRDSAGASRNYLMARDLTGGVAVGDGKSLAVDYTWTQGL